MQIQIDGLSKQQTDEVDVAIAQGGRGPIEVVRRAHYACICLASFGCIRKTLNAWW